MALMFPMIGLITITAHISLLKGLFSLAGNISYNFIVWSYLQPLKSYLTLIDHTYYTVHMFEHRAVGSIYSAVYATII